MNETTSPDYEEPSLLAALFRRWYVVLAIPAAIVGLLLLAGEARSSDFVAEAELVLDDPLAQGLDRVDAERYAADQATILRSPAVAQRAAASLGSDPTAVEDATEVIGDDFSNRIVVRYTATSETAAIAGATAVVESYLVSVASRADARAELAKAELEVAIGVIDDEISALDEQLRDADSAAEIAAFTTALDALIEQRRDLSARSADAVVDAALRADPVAVVSLPLEADEVPFPSVRLLAAGVLLGLVLGGVAAYLIDLRRAQRVRAISHPDEVLGVQTLGFLPARSSSRKERTLGLLDKNQEVRSSYESMARTTLLAAEGKGAHVLVVTAADDTGPVSEPALSLTVEAERLGRRSRFIDATSTNELDSILGSLRPQSDEATGWTQVELADVEVAMIRQGHSPGLGNGQAPFAADYVRRATIGVDLLLVAVPPLGATQTALSLAREADAVVVVTTPSTSDAELAETKRLMELGHLAVIGVIHADVPTKYLDEGRSTVRS